MASINVESSENVGDENRGESRMKQYKNAGKPEDMRRRRTECSVEIRKQKRDEAVMKRRNIQDELAGESSAEDSPLQAKETPREMTVRQIINSLSANPTVDTMRVCFEDIRHMVSRSKSPPIDEIINAGLHNALIQALNVDDGKVQLEAMWSLTNIVSGTTEQTMAVVDQGVIPPIIAHCKSEDLQLAEQALWAAANIVGESAALRDLTIAHGMIETLEYLVSSIQQMSKQFVRTLAWMYSNMCRHRNPSVPLTVLKRIAPGIIRLLNYPDDLVCQDACWAMSYMTDGSDEHIQLAYDAGCISPLMKMLMSMQDSKVAPAVRVFGNFASGNDTLTQVVVDNGVLHEILKVMNQTNSHTVTKECCWLTSNVLAGTQAQIQAVIDAKLIPAIVKVMENGDSRSQLEASWAISNMCHGSRASQLKSIATKEALQVLCGSLKGSNPDLLGNVLDSMYCILKVMSSLENDALQATLIVIEECGGLDNLEKLQEHENRKVYEIAYKIIEEFFVEENEENAALDIGDDEPINFNF